MHCLKFVFTQSVCEVLKLNTGALLPFDQVIERNKRGSCIKWFPKFCPINSDCCWRCCHWPSSLSLDERRGSSVPASLPPCRLHGLRRAPVLRWDLRTVKGLLHLVKKSVTKAPKITPLPQTLRGCLRVLSSSFKTTVNLYAFGLSAVLAARPWGWQCQWVGPLGPPLWSGHTYLNNYW